MRHRFDAALVAVLVLIAAAAPALRLAPTLADASALPANFQSRQVTDSIDATFVPHLLYPVDIAVHTSGARSSSGSARASALPAGLLAVSLQRTGAAQVVAVTPGRLGTTLVQAVLRSPPYAARSQALIRGVRALPSRPLVGGNTAEFVDLKHSIAARAPWAILIAAVVTVLVLLVLTRSIVLAAKSLVLDLLGLGAALGLLVLIFQHRALGVAGFLGFHGPSAIETTSAVVIVASAYGLTTDYSVLLLARIVEAHDAEADDRDAVATGVARTAPVITSAALLLTVALLALTSSRLFLIKQLTVGQILAVLVDVTVVRLLLVPAFMAIFGGANWWAPRWIRSALRRVAPAPHA